MAREDASMSNRRKYLLGMVASGLAAPAILRRAWAQTISGPANLLTQFPTNTTGLITPANSQNLTESVFADFMKTQPSNLHTNPLSSGAVVGSSGGSAGTLSGTLPTGVSVGFGQGSLVPLCGCDWRQPSGSAILGLKYIRHHIHDAFRFELCSVPDRRYHLHPSVVVYVQPPDGIIGRCAYKCHRGTTRSNL